MHHNGKEQVDDTTKKAQERLNKILGQVKSRGKILFDKGVANARSIYEEKARAARQKANEIGEKSVNEISSDIKTYIQENPFKAIGFAVAAGLLLGFIFKPESDAVND